MRSILLSGALLGMLVPGGCSQNKVELDKSSTVAWDRQRDGDPTVPNLGGGGGGAMSGKGKFGKTGTAPAGAAPTTPPSTPPK